MRSYRPALSNSVCASARSKTAKVAVPSDLTSANVATPTTSNSRASPRVATFTRSPIAYFSFSAVAWSMTTSPPPAAQRPSASRNGVSRSAPGVRASKPVPKYGPSPTGLPSRPTIWAVSVTSPAAISTPGARWTRSSVAAARVGVSAHPSMLGSNVVSAVTTASVPS
jgi:hypothetical protein